MKTHALNRRFSNLYGENGTYCGITGYATYGEENPDGSITPMRVLANSIMWSEFPTCKRCQKGKFG